MYYVSKMYKFENVLCNVELADKLGDLGASADHSHLHAVGPGLELADDFVGPPLNLKKGNPI